MSVRPAVPTVDAVVPIKPDTDEFPTLASRSEVVAYCKSLGVVVTERYVKQCQNDHSLPHFIVARRGQFSRAGVRKWLASLE